jgi:hypothetical protein
MPIRVIFIGSSRSRIAQENAASIFHRVSWYFALLFGAGACIGIATKGKIVATEIGGVMLARLIIVIATSALLGACTNSDPLRSDLGGPTAAYELEAEIGKQTLASKVLGAIALERVTGRKPDPARFTELH